MYIITHKKIYIVDIIPSPSSTKSFTTSTIYDKIAPSPPTAVGYPITFHHLEESITLVTETESTRKLWMDKINDH